MKITQNSLLRRGLLLASIALIIGPVCRAQTIITTVSDVLIKNPLWVAVNPGNNRIYIANENSHILTVLDGATNTVSASVSAGTSPQAMVINPGTNKIYESSTGQVTVINGAANTVTTIINFGFAQPSALAINGTTNRICATFVNPNSLAVIDGIS